MNVANGIEKNTPQKPNILPNMNTARIITTGCNFTASEKIIGTKDCHQEIEAIDKVQLINKIECLDQTAIIQ